MIFIILKYLIKILFKILSMNEKISLKFSENIDLVSQKERISS